MTHVGGTSGAPLHRPADMNHACLSRLAMTHIGWDRTLRSLYARLPPAKTAGHSRTPARAADRSCPPEPAVPRPGSRSLSISVFRAFLGENARPAREVGDRAWDRYWPGLLAEVDDALMWSSTGPATVPVQDGAGAATALLEDVADRALRSEFKPDDVAGAGVVAEAVGDQSAQRPVITGSGDVMKVTMHFRN